MPVTQQILTLRTRGQGTYEITDDIARVVTASGISSGIATVFCQHTSCSLVIMENADPSARHDLEAWMNRLVPERNPAFTHTLEGDDDMPSHIKMALTRSSETLPVADSKLVLGTWQGVFVWEHRRTAHDRRLMITVLGN
jgi:secondary thiamine-phosphate synthase enzyme